MIYVITIVLGFIIGYSLSKINKKNKIYGTLFIKSNEDSNMPEECFFEFIETPNEVKNHRKILINVKSI